MSSYEDITRQIGDQWVAALQRAEESVTSFAEEVVEARGNLDIPQVPVPEQLSKLTETLSEQFPKPSEVVEANFELTERLLNAQKALTLKVLAASEPKAAAAAKASTSAK